MLHFLIILEPDFHAGIVQDTLAVEAGEGEGGDEEMTGGYFYCSARNSSVS